MRKFDKKEALQIIEYAFQYSEFVYIPIIVTTGSLADYAADSDDEITIDPSKYEIDLGTFTKVIKAYENSDDVWISSNETLAELAARFVKNSGE